MKIKLLAFILIVMTLTPSLCGAGTDGGEKIKKYSGTVSQIDWVGSKIVVRMISANSGRSDETTFYVPGDAVMRSGLKNISLKEIRQGDNVQLDYCGKDLAGLWVVSLEDSNPLEASRTIRQ